MASVRKTISCEATATAQECNGVYRPGLADQTLIHHHPQHLPEKGGLHRDPQEPTEDPGKETGQLHPLGPSQHPGGPVKEVSLPALSPPGQRAHDGQPHQYLLGERSLLLSFCYWESIPGLQEW